MKYLAILFVAASFYGCGVATEPDTSYWVGTYVAKYVNSRPIEDYGVVAASIEFREDLTCISRFEAQGEPMSVNECRYSEPTALGQSDIDIFHENYTESYLLVFDKKDWLRMLTGPYIWEFQKQ